MTFKPTGQGNRTEWLKFRMSPRELNNLRAAAKKQGMTVSSFVRQGLVYAMDNMEGD